MSSQFNEISPSIDTQLVTTVTPLFIDSSTKRLTTDCPSKTVHNNFIESVPMKNSLEFSTKLKLYQPQLANALPSLCPTELSLSPTVKTAVRIFKFGKRPISVAVFLKWFIDQPIHTVIASASCIANNPFNQAIHVGLPNVLACRSCSLMQYRSNDNNRRLKLTQLYAAKSSSPVQHLILSLS